MLRRRAFGFVIGFTLGLVASLARDARADSLSSIPDLGYAHDGVTFQTDAIDRRINYIVYPTIGLPSICAWGEDLTVYVRLLDGGVTTGWTVNLVPTQAPATRTHTPAVTRATYDVGSGTYRLQVAIRNDIPRDTYDLIVRSPGLPGAEDRQIQCVRVLREHGRRYRFIHICDSQLQDPTTVLPSLFPVLFEEIRLLDPDFVVYSGDWNFGSDYTNEYTENYNLFRSIGVPVFFVPGNHDGYATVIPTGTTPPDDPPGELRRDGLNHWRAMLGPTDFSFDVGNMHFVGLNSYSGDAKRRNAMGFWVYNYGGEVSQAQLGWLEQDMARAAARGQHIVLFCHHNFNRTIVPNIDVYPFSYGLPASPWQDWNDPWSQGELFRLVAQYPVSDILIGHVHHDDYEDLVVNRGTALERTVHVITTTAATNGRPPQPGYRVIEVDGDRFASWDYKPLGTGRTSWPIDVVSNFQVSFSTPNNGTSDRVAFQVDSFLERSAPLTIDCYLASVSGGYRATGARIDQVAPADGGGAVVTVVADMSPYGTALVTVEKDPAGEGYPVGYPGTATGHGGSHGGSATFGCAPGAPGAPSDPWSALLPLLALLLVAVVARVRRAI